MMPRFFVHGWDAVAVTERGGSDQRRQAFRVVRDRLGDMRGLPEVEVRETVTAELARNGITDATDAEQQVLIDLARLSPRRAGWRLVGRQVENLVKVAREVHQTLKADEPPEWARVPKRVPRVPFGPDQPETVAVAVAVTADDLANAREIIARLINELRDWGEDGRPIREVEGWVCLDEPGQISVRIGTREVARLPESAVITDAVRRWGGKSRTLRTSGFLYGADASTATIELDVETPVE